MNANPDLSAATVIVRDTILDWFCTENGVNPEDAEDSGGEAANRLFQEGLLNGAFAEPHLRTQIKSESVVLPLDTFRTIYLTLRDLSSPFTSNEQMVEQIKAERQLWKLVEALRIEQGIHFTD